MPPRLFVWHVGQAFVGVLAVAFALSVLTEAGGTKLSTKVAVVAMASGFAVASVAALASSRDDRLIYHVRLWGASGDDEQASPWHWAQAVGYIVGLIGWCSILVLAVLVGL